MEWQKLSHKLLSFFNKKDRHILQNASVDLSVDTFKQIYRNWLVDRCQHLTDIPIGPIKNPPKLTDLYCPIKLESVEPIVTRSPEEFNLNKAMSTHKQLLLTAPSGAGKTTLCRFLALKAAEYQSTTDDETLAFFIPLKILNFTQELDSSEADVSLENILKLAIPNHIIQNHEIHTFIEEKLASGKCLFLFDGMDEVINRDVRKKWLSGISEFAQEHQNNYFIITSDPSIFKTANNKNSQISFARFNIKKFSTQDIKQYLDKHYDYLRNITELDQSLDLDKFLEEIQKQPELEKLCQTPMMLCMMFSLYTDKAPLEHQQAALFQSYLNQCSLWQSSEGCHPLEWQFVLERIAYTMHKNGAKHILKNWCKQVMISEFDSLNHALTPDEIDIILTSCQNNQSIFTTFNLSSENDTFEFCHKSFQDFFTAKQLHHKGQEGLSIIKTSIDPTNNKNHEILMFYVMLAKKTLIKGDEIIHWLLTPENNSSDSILLASQLALKADTISSIAAERIQDNLENLKTYTDQNISESANIAFKALSSKHNLSQELLMTQS